MSLQSSLIHYFSVISISYKKGHPSLVKKPKQLEKLLINSVLAKLLFRFTRANHMNRLPSDITLSNEIELRIRLFEIDIMSASRKSEVRKLNETLQLRNFQIEMWFFRKGAS